MAAASCRCSSVVFVGNIPYHASEEELRAACEEIGPVVPRGFAFVEYLDDETALSACRNLHGRALRGRDLRVGLARQQGATTRDDKDDDQPVGAEDATHAASLLAPGARPSGAVTAYLAGLSWRQLRELLGALGREDPGLVERAKRERGCCSTYGAAAAKGRRKRGAGGRERPGASPEPADQQPLKLRRLEDDRPVPGVVRR
ncbi:hypothetical protein SETIT_4G245600v2 [Setaria italica]|uniref:RRM domain-containing protein n=1 Tax=Setaria italica TaxID=4555 RepID=K3Y264_SETIT|nr:hypothetical protein SETIT_4G245600v2 [Setaria italica]